MMRRSRHSRPLYRFERAITFYTTVGCPSIFLEEVPDAVFLGVDVESSLDEKKVLSLETSVQVRNGHNC